MSRAGKTGPFAPSHACTQAHLHAHVLAHTMHTLRAHNSTKRPRTCQLELVHEALSAQELHPAAAPPVGLLRAAYGVVNGKTKLPRGGVAVLQQGNKNSKMGQRCGGAAHRGGGADEVRRHVAGLGRLGEHSAHEHKHASRRPLVGSCFSCMCVCAFSCACTFANGRRVQAFCSTGSPSLPRAAPCQLTVGVAKCICARRLPSSAWRTDMQAVAKGMQGSVSRALRSWPHSGEA